MLHTHPYVLVTFIDDDCTICQALAPNMERIANDPRFAHVVFLRVAAAANPIAAQSVPFSKAPFIAAYYTGRLLHCGTVFGAGRIDEILSEHLAAR